MERVILTTGGTGGHIFPAIAVAEEIRRRYPRCMILFVGSTYGPEADMAVNAGLSFTGLPVRGVVGRGGKGIFAAVNMTRGIAKALGIIRKVKPQGVVGFGGYAAFAAVLAAKISGKPTAIHEQNSIPGLTNTILGKAANRIFLSMPDTTGAFPAKKTLLVGNPVRAAIAALSETEKDAHSSRPPRLLVMGGSLGARAINRAVVENLAPLLEAGIEICHQTGRAEYEEIRAGYRAAKAEHVRVEPFIEDMRRAYEWADLALCRAGGSSIAELTAAGLPSVLVPYPFAARDHQRHNALFLVNAGAAMLMEQSALSAGHTLSETLLLLLRDTQRLASMARAAHSLAKPGAAASIVDALETLIGKQ